MFSKSNKEASALLYKGLLSYPEYPFGTRPYFISLINVSNTSLAILNLLVFNNKPSNDIRLSLPQSKNHGQPAIIVCSPNDGLYAIKLSVVIIKSYINSLSSVFSVISFVSSTIAFNLFSSFCISSSTLISSIFSSNENINETFFSSFGSISISYLPGIA